MKTKLLAATVLGALVMSVIPGFAQEHQSKRLTIPAGKTTVSTTGSITGFQDIDYMIDAKAGQTMTVTLKSNKTSNYFLVFGPMDAQTAIYNSDAGSQTWTKTLDQTGNYTVRVYLYRNAARNNVKANFTLTVAVKNGATKPGDAKVAGTKFNATGEVQAALVPTATLGSSMAEFGVIRYANGEADIHLTNANGGKRIIKYSNGSFKCISPSGCKVTSTRRNSEEWVVKFNDTESYLIYNAIVFGG